MSVAKPKAKRRCEDCFELFPPDDLNDCWQCEECEAEEADEANFEMFPDHEGLGHDTAMWRDTFGGGK